MKQITKQKSVEMMRFYQVILLRAWRSTLYCQDDTEIAFSDLKKVCDSDMASMIGITKSNFSRLIKGVYTVSSPVLVQIYSAMSNSIGRSKFISIRNSCLEYTYTRFCSESNA